MYRLRPNTEQYQTYIRQSTETFARSLFVLYLLLLMFVMVGLIVLLQSGVLTISLPFVVMMGVVLVPVGWIFNKLLRTNPEQLMERSHRLVWMFTNPIVNIIITGLIVETIIFVILFDRKFSVSSSNIALLLGMISLWLAIVWVIVSYPMLRSALEHPIWMLTTLVVLVVVVMFNLIQLNESWLRDLNREQSIRVGLNAYMGDDVLQADNRTYWTEYHNLPFQESTFIGYRTQQTDGIYINIDDEGLRRSVELPELDDAIGEVSIHFYGGSTMWGFGAADDGTIPSFVATMLHDRQYDVDVSNFAHVGYHSFNDFTVLTPQLLNGNIPDIVVLYQGYNDIALGTARRGYIGTDKTQSTLTHIPIETAEDYFDYYQRYVASIYALADIYEFEVVFVWQPMWMNKTLTDYEQLVIWQSKLFNSDRVGEIYAQVNPYIETLSNRPTIPHFLNYVDLFADEPDTIFMDIVHITTQGNQRVAEELSNYIYENILQTN